MTAETYAERVSRIAREHDVDGVTARRVARAELRIEARKAELARERASRAAWLARRERNLAIRLSHVEGVRYGLPALIHNGGKP